MHGNSLIQLKTFQYQDLISLNAPATGDLSVHRAASLPSVVTFLPHVYYVICLHSVYMPHPNRPYMHPHAAYAVLGQWVQAHWDVASNRPWQRERKHYKKCERCLKHTLKRPTTQTKRHIETRMSPAGRKCGTSYCTWTTLISQKPLQVTKNVPLTQPALLCWTLPFFLLHFLHSHFCFTGLLLFWLYLFMRVCQTVLSFHLSFHLLLTFFLCLFCKSEHT